MREQAVVGLGMVSYRVKDVVKPLAGVLNDPDDRVRRAAAGVLGGIGKPSLPFLVSALKSNRVDVRKAAVETLWGLNAQLTEAEKKDIVALLIPLLGDEEEVQRSLGSVMRGLGKPAVSALLTAMKSKEAAVRKGAVLVVRDLGDAARPAIPALRDLCSDVDPDVRGEAELTLLMLTGRPALAVLLDAAPSQPAYAGKRLSDWLTALASNNQAEADAARAALRRDSKKLVPLLAAGLDKGNEWERCGAARLLTELGPLAEPALPQLIAALKSPHERLYEDATSALRAIGPPARAAVDPLLEMLGDKDRESRRRAAQALGRLGREARRAFPALLRALEDREPSVRATVVSALGPTGEVKTSLPAVIERLSDKDPQVRDSAVFALGYFGRDATPALGPLLRLLHKQPSTRMSVMFTLKEIGPPAVPALIELLQDSNVKVRSSAAYTLGEVGPEAKEAATPLIRALKDRSPEVQSRAGWALEAIGPPAIPALVAALRDRDESVRSEAGSALAKIGKPAIKPVAEVLRGTDRKARKQAADVLAHVGEPAMPYLVAALEDKDAAVRKEVVSAMLTASLLGEDLLKPLAVALNDPDEKVRSLACFALGRAGKPSLPFLNRALKSNRAYVRAAAASALAEAVSGRTDKEKAEIAALLVPLLGDKEEVLGSITFALMRLGQPAVPLLIDALKDKKAAVRKGAIEALGRLGGDARQAIPALKEVCHKDDDPAVRDQAKQVLEMLHFDEAIPLPR